MINKVILVGFLGDNPKVFKTQNGSKLVTMSVATTDSWKDKATGERKTKTEWHKVIVYNSSLVEVAEKYLTKGSKVYLEGSIQTRKYDKNGEERYITEIVLQNFGSTLIILDSKDKEDFDSNQRNDFEETPF